MGTFAVFSVVRFYVSASVAMGAVEAGVMCPASPAATQYSGAAVSAAVARGVGLQALPLLFPWFLPPSVPLLCVFQSTHL